MISDPEIETLIARLVAADPELRPRQLSIASYMGQVTLYGELESEAQREKALAIAASVQGVQKVIDHLTTGAASPAG
ncbi:MAG TPA: BON domain-containing protein, partial [Aggregatilineales bacterium]|nr:BON domain-containing protein [Aggregatilineales bacterium]